MKFQIQDAGLQILPYDFCHKTVTLELSTNNI